MTADEPAGPAEGPAESKGPDPAGTTSGDQSGGRQRHGLGLLETLPAKTVRLIDSAFSGASAKCAADSMVCSCRPG